ncbi:uncharacterized protein BDR25DRAFT_359181 [Lindgomyces ingoldianus]|uniref:Uncharacterized protein n=1 Tax=Lindgomyces ingoldianus TaxID=673940 RepID=A0ACB6QIE6_9PLEO|nr:uncharacterized protein BDR25DRAFT_359181 [Lindgomyces ingoldianus]KAF2466665.1 hypothetical protein BDR25DRAFT_359181 [Lindgomyces ingoldianus]
MREVATLFNISFDATGSYLCTEIGRVDINGSNSSSLASITMTSISVPQNPIYRGLALSSDGAWITYNSENLVWLPSEYRPLRSIVSGDRIGIGTGSGKHELMDYYFTTAKLSPPSG